MDDIVVKSKRREEHFYMLKRVFERCKAFKLRMNPLKCAFGVLWEILGFLGSQQRDRCGPGQSHDYSNYETSGHDERVKKFLRKSLIHPEIHS